MKKKYLLISLLLNTFIGFAQKPQLLFEQINDKSGRSIGFITGISQDNKGYMWFATRNGLVRYDGYDYSWFKNNDADSLSIPFNNITHLYKDPDNYFWLRTYDKLGIFKNERNYKAFPNLTNKRYDQGVKVLSDSAGNVWIGPDERKLLKYNKKTDSSFYFIEPQPEYLPEAYKFFSEKHTENLVTEIIGVKNNANISVDAEIVEAGYYLIVSVGEADEFDVYDYGSLSLGNKTIWKMNHANGMQAGGNESQKVDAQILQLIPGKYKLSYNSDNTNATDNWRTEPPTKVNFYGIKLVRIPETQLNLIKAQLKRFKPLNSIITAGIDDMIINSAGKLCLASGKGIEIYNSADNSFKFYEIPFTELFGLQPEEPVKIHKLYQTKNGHYWFGTDYGVVVFNLKSKKFSTYFNNLKTPDLLTDNRVYSFLEDVSEQTIWIGTQNGLNLLDFQKQTVYKYTADNFNRLYGNYILHLFRDKSNNIWIGTPGGLNKLIKSPFKFYDFNFAAELFSNYKVYTETTDILWYGTQNYLVRFDRKKNLYNRFEIDKNLFPKNEFQGDRWFIYNDFYNDSKQNFWVAINNGFYRLNKTTGIIEAKYSTGSNIFMGFPSDNVIHKMREDKKGNFWIFAANGVYLFNRKTESIEKFLSFNLPFEEIFKQEEESKFIKDVIHSTTDNFYIKNGVGIWVLNTEKKTLKKLTTFEENVQLSASANGNMVEDSLGNIRYAIFPKIYSVSPNAQGSTSITIPLQADVAESNILLDKNGVIWLYTSSGIFKYNEKTKVVKRFSTEDGFADNNINGLIDDHRGNLWLSTNQGLIKFDKNKLEVENLFVANDIISHKFVGISQVNRQANGEILLLTSKGALSFFPDSINKRKPQISITRFTMFGKDFPLDSAVYLKKLIELDYYENFIGFEFSALDFTAPADNRYRYKLEGVDKDWTEVDASNRRAPYTNLSHGHYIFKLQGSNNDGIWNTEGTEVHIIIIPPWYKTTLAYISYVIIIILLFWAFIKYREQKLQQEKRVLEQKVLERTAEIEKQKKEIELQRDIATVQRDKISEQKKSITDSIQYARRIQTAVLPPLEIISDVLSDMFILNRPRDIVSGDFYWFSRSENKLIITAADCTGHGVPGAFMSMLGVAFLNEIVNKLQIQNANEILNQLKSNVIKSLHQTGKENEAKDGMDIALAIIDFDTMKLQFSGAYNPLLLIRQGEIVQFKADRMPIGIYFKAEESFTNHEFDLLKGDSLYMFSDGYVDQFGGPDGRKFMIKNFKELLAQNCHLPFEEQKELLDKSIIAWMREHEQIDDILVVGLKI